MAELTTVASAIASMQEELVLLGGSAAMVGIGLVLLYQKTLEVDKKKRLAPITFP